MTESHASKRSAGPNTRGSSGCSISIAGTSGWQRSWPQEALTRVYRHWKRVSAMDKPQAWAQRVAVNLANSHFRRKKAERKARERLDLPDPLASDPADDISLREGIAALSHKMKTALILRYYADLPFAEVGERMHIPEATARSLVHRAIRRLRADMDPTELQEAFDG